MWVKTIWQFVGVVCIATGIHHYESARWLWYVLAIFGALSLMAANHVKVKSEEEG